ncbi:protease modulator HflC [Cupriavidus taiwanensis]|uniref:protease modulator HflC n=1 Tax=Cupriavidus taiwanensis TaxID=164546 RepID=UPI000E106C59|nr:protease modulator HflC [Cupriavidus taiwanensis]SOY43312.1 Protein hflC, cofactor of ATP-dependent protease FtsH [Cupriavidus taiwanensis]SOY45791.1 Protein hflC, cofactor of ATP-dependent protease FtsH [Cupriavidus taiwanensis]SOY81249.1 Protein hflC, cofactor of ATP-dependent protease FtsH [Cupriavidus taiwanensis]SOZ54098.1 Protein hflC, cofactor of ATP-dependent protease FtsH [Cupriavidus taiwanensis]SOZ77797.1 Protein hflC, cofactor of ATP-dependent protease FtsH [Cupriavidus taiwanen
MNRLISFAIGFFILLAVVSSMLFVVDQRQYAVVFAFGQIKEVVREPGLHFKLPPPFQNVVFMDRRLQTIDVAANERFLTAEKKSMVVDWFVKWRITDPRKFFVAFGGNLRGAQDRMTQRIDSVAREEFGKRTVADVVAGEREQVMQAIRNGMSEYAKSVGVEILDVRLKRVDLLPAISESVYRRMEAERKRVANELRSTGAAEGEKIRADADRQREVVLAQAYRDAQMIKGEGDAKASQIYGEAFGRDPQFAQFWRSMEAYRNTFRDKRDVLVLEPNSEFFRYMRSSGGGAGASAGNGGGKR